MKKNIYNSILYLLIVFCLSSCVEEYDPELPVQNTGLLVLNGNLVPDGTFTLDITLTCGLDGTSEDFFNIHDFRVEIRTDNQYGSHVYTPRDETYSYNTGEDTTGDYLSYKCDFGCQDLSCVFRVVIYYDGEVYETSQMRFVNSSSDLDCLKGYYNSVTDEVDVLISSSSDEEDKELYYMASVDEVWEINTPYRPIYEFDYLEGRVKPVVNSVSHGWREQTGLVRCYKKSSGEKSVCNHTIYSFPCVDKRFNTQYYANVSLHQISREEYEYREISRKLDEEMGGLFTPMPSENNGNITCTSNPDKKCIGYIGLQSFSGERSVFISSKEAHYRKNYVLPKYFEVQLDDYFYWWMNGYRICYSEPGFDGGLSHYWTHRRWTDCTDAYWGATTLDRPSFWIN